MRIGFWGRAALAIMLAASGVVGSAQAASASSALTIAIPQPPDGDGPFTYVASGGAEVPSYLQLFVQPGDDGPCADTVTHETNADGATNVGTFTLPAGDFSETRSVGIFGGPGVYVVCGYLRPQTSSTADLPTVAAASAPMTYRACAAPPTLTLTHIEVTTSSPPYGGLFQATAEVNGPGEVRTLDATGQKFSDNGDTTTDADTHEAYGVLEGGGRHRPGDVRTYDVTFLPYGSGACYDTGTGTVIDTTGAHVTERLTVTYFSAGQGGTGQVDGALLPGSDRETPVPGKPSPVVKGSHRVGTIDVCAVAIPAGDYATYAWTLAGRAVGTKQSYRIPSTARGKRLSCTATLANNAGVPGPSGASRSVVVKR